MLLTSVFSPSRSYRLNGLVILPEEDMNAVDLGKAKEGAVVADGFLRHVWLLFSALGGVPRRTSWLSNAQSVRRVSPIK
jgi:hypothetical protein